MRRGEHISRVLFLNDHPQTYAAAAAAAVT